ncbi:MULTISPECIES: hypothetical protein [Pseudomonas]|uniref:hypothetical protein n=1 Tax=Pseudomonas TaxID=286 RepID=UPI0030023BB3
MRRVRINVRSALTIMCFLSAAGCTHLDLNLKDAALFDVDTLVGAVQTKSMGEVLLRNSVCPCYENYETTEELKFDGYRSATRNSNWVARYINPVSNEKYLVNNAFHPALTLVLVPAAVPTLSVDHAVLQVAGSRQGRTWSLSNPGQAKSIRTAGYTFAGMRKWELQYIGLDKNQPQVLRFTIDDLTRNGERAGQIEYVHDLRKGKEFVIRGVRIRIDDVTSDGLITYVVVADNDVKGAW